MIAKLPTAILTALLVLGAAAWAADEHHPASDAGAPSATTSGPATQMPMGGSMGQMLTGGMMAGSGSSGMMSMMAMMADHVEGRLAFLKAELKITEAQTAPWSAFADAVRANAKTMHGMQQSMMQGGAETLPARLDQHEKVMSARLEALRTIKAAVEPLYASFSDEQKHTADELMAGPMGLMGMM